jgi:hypothetical protein
MGGCGFSYGYRERLHIASHGRSLQTRPFSIDLNCLARCVAFARRAAKASSVSVRVASGHLPRGRARPFIAQALTASQKVGGCVLPKRKGASRLRCGCASSCGVVPGVT